MKWIKTQKELDRKIKDYDMGNLKQWNYPDLINHLIQFKEAVHGWEESPSCPFSQEEDE